MKKILILVTVLISTSLVNAGVYLYINDALAPSSITIGVGEEITLQGYSDDASIWTRYVIVFDTEDDVGALYDCVTLPSAGGMAANEFYTEEGWGTGYLITTAGAPPVSGIVAGVQHTIKFSSSVPGSAHIGLMQASEPYGELQGIDVTIIPEPITVSLLGLGSLFIRRRK